MLPCKETPAENAHSVIGVPIGGAGVFPLGISKTFAQQFIGNRRANSVLALAELLYAAGCESRLKMYFVTLPEWQLFADNNFVLDTPETTINFMLYYILIIVFPSEDAEMVFKGVVARLITDNNLLKEQRPISNEDEEPRPSTGSSSSFRKVTETPRVKVGKFGVNGDVATQLQFTSIHDLNKALSATGCANNGLVLEDDLLPDQVWNAIKSSLLLNNVIATLQEIKGLEYPPFIQSLKTQGSHFHVPAGFVQHKLIYSLPHVAGKDQLALFMLPGVLNPVQEYTCNNDFDAPIIGESIDTVFVSSETRGFSFKDPSKLLSPMPAICSKIFRRLLRLAPTPAKWKEIYQYCHKYMRMLFTDPFVAGFPSIYRDLFTEIERLRVKRAGDKLMNQFYSPQTLPKGQGIVHHNISLIIALLHSAGLRDNHVVVALAYLSASGSCRIFGGDSDITAFTGTAGKGKSNILNMISALVNDVSQYSMDAASARAITMPLNPVVIAGRVVGEAPQNGRITFTDDGAGAFQPSKGSHADKDGDAMKLTQASRGCITYQVINPHEDERGNKINKVQTRVVACKSSRFMAMNGNSGSSAGASRMQCFYVKSSGVAPGNSASAVCPLDVNGVPDELESMYAANQLRNAEVSFYNALIAFGLANDATLSLWQIFIVRALELPTSIRDFPEEIKILQSPRKVGALVRNSLNLANNKLFHLLETAGFGQQFIGNDSFKKYMWLQQTNYVSTELIVLALSSALPICNGASNITEAIYRQIKDLVEFEVMAPFQPKNIRKGGKCYYVLRDVKNFASLLQIILDHMPEYESADVTAKLSDICKSAVPHSRQQFLEKDGDHIIFYAKPLDNIFGCIELNVLAIIKAQLDLFNKQHPQLHDCFPHDTSDEYLLVPSDQTYIFSRHANNDRINELGNEFEMGLSILQYNTTCGRALALNATQDVHPRDIPRPDVLRHHFPGTEKLKGCTAISLKALHKSGSDLATGVLNLVPCFRDETCMIATGKNHRPDVPETIKLQAITESFTITNPHYCQSLNRSLPTLETSVIEKEFFGTDYMFIEIPPGFITETYMLYVRCYVLHRQLPMTISRPDFIDHFLKHGNVNTYSAFLPSEPATPPKDNTVSIYSLFCSLAHKMVAQGLQDEILEHLVQTSKKRKQ